MKRKFWLPVLALALLLTGCVQLPELGAEVLQEPQQTEAVQPIQQSRLGFYGKNLTESEQRVYLTILDGLEQMEPEIDGIRLNTTDQLEAINMAVLHDHGEIFWYKGAMQYSYYERRERLIMKVQPSYVYQKEDIPRMQQQIHGVTDPVVESLQGLSDYEKVRGVYDYVTQLADYDTDYLSTGIYEFFCSGAGVCEGYTRAVQYLLDQLGVENIYVYGEAENEKYGRALHAWNMVKIQGDWCQLDATWGDLNGEGTRLYAYLNLTDGQILQDHMPDYQGYPPCTTDAWSYYRMEGYYLEEYDPRTLKTMLKKAAKTGNFLEFRASSPEVYEQCRRELDENQQIHPLVEQATGAKGTKWLTWSPEQQVIRISWNQ